MGEQPARLAKCYLRVVNWEAFQHYGDRLPPWIKLHVSVLEDPVVAALPDHSKAHVFGIWVLASRLKNKIPNDARFIGARINATEPVDLKSLIFASFLEHHPECECGASAVLAKRSTDKEEKRVEERRVESGAPAPVEPPPTTATPSEAKALALSVLGPPDRSGRQTWLTKPGELWRARWGEESEPPWGEMGSAFARPRKAFESRGELDELWARWERFLAATERAEWARPARFVQGLGQWGAEGRPAARASPRAGSSVGDRALSESEKFINAARRGGKM